MSKYVCDALCGCCQARLPYTTWKAYTTERCPYCRAAASERTVTKTYGRTKWTEKRAVPIDMHCVDCWQHSTADTWHHSVRACEACGGTRAPEWILPFGSNDKPADAPVLDAVPWAKHDAVMKIAAWDDSKRPRKSIVTKVGEWLWYGDTK